MAKLTPPKWAPDATPTTNGWVRGRELLVSTKISQNDIDEYYGKPDAATLLTEAPIGNKSLDEMNPVETQALQETSGLKGFIGKFTSLNENNDD